jgi:hypothetical protein
LRNIQDLPIQRPGGFLGYSQVSHWEDQR